MTGFFSVCYCLLPGSKGTGYMEGYKDKSPRQAEAFN